MRDKPSALRAEVPAPLVGRTASSVAEVVETGLCIGCGLCEAIAPDRVTMQMSPVGAMRPAPVDAFTPSEEAAVLAACPGVIAPGRGQGDPVWGPTDLFAMAWAGDDDVRFRAATGGVLTALAMHLLRRGSINFVLHVGADPQSPMRTGWVMSESPAEVLENAGSRYGPTSPLAGLASALDRDEPFAVVAKPCDIGALRRRAIQDERLDRNLMAALAMVCGGQSRITKSQGVLDELGVDESEVTLFRYRGYGNPGPTRVESAAGAEHEISYLSMWQDEGTWDLDARCTICPDALGEMADVAAADAWPGGAPTGQDEGFNAIAVHGSIGSELVASAVAAGDLVLGDEIDARWFDHLQPHQVRKKRALPARLAGRAAAGLPTIATPGLRLEACAADLSGEETAREREGTERRASEGRYREVAVRLK